ncbi:MAG: rRNA pseudouridine synthase [Deltaproteobacteria bacterium]|nr:rRNA pseudouridine synthase [Deltaproteobacteria bacterium]
MAEERLQKLIAAAGLASRREAERLIMAGRVQINGKVVKVLGSKADLDHDDVRVDGQVLERPSVGIYLALHKPTGVVSAVQDHRGRKTVMDLLGDFGSRRGSKRVFHVGRLDYNSEGLLLLTNDGDLARDLMHPSSQVPRTYHVRVQGEPQPKLLLRLIEGVRLEDGMARVLDAQIIKRNPRSTWIELSVAEGRNRLVRRLMEAVGHSVLRLVRRSYGGVDLGGLRVGAVRHLDIEEVERLRAWSAKSGAKKKKEEGR